MRRVVAAAASASLVCAACTAEESATPTSGTRSAASAGVSVPASVLQPPTTETSTAPTSSSSPAETDPEWLRDAVLPPEYAEVELGDGAEMHRRTSNRRSFGIGVAPDGTRISTPRGPTLDTNPPGAILSDGRDRVRISTPKWAGPVVDVSADERFLVLVTDPSTDFVYQDWRIWVWDRRDEQLRMLMERPSRPGGNGLWASPLVLPSVHDGSAVWSAGTGAGRSTLFRAELDGGRPERLVDGVFFPALTEVGLFGLTDGQNRVVRVQDDGSLVRLPVPAGATNLAATSQGHLFVPSTEPDRRTVHLVEPDGETVTRLGLPLEPTWPTGGDRLFAWGTRRSSYALDVGDGRRRLIHLAVAPGTAHASVSGRWVTWRSDDPRHDGFNNPGFTNVAFLGLSG